MCYEIEIVPRDVMYFRDARPIGASSDGNGASWPLPSTFHSAMMSAFHHQISEQSEEWESTHTPTAKEQKKLGTQYKFGGMKTWGPFPKDSKNMIYLPTPADLLPSEKAEVSSGIMTPIAIGGRSNLPAPLSYPVASTEPPSKNSLGQWLSIAEYQKYLDGESKGLKTTRSEELFGTEARPGIGINPATNTTEEGKFYSAEYLRLKSYISMVAFASCEAKKFNQSTGKDLFEEFFADSNKSSFVFGGQRGVAWLEAKRDKVTSPLSLKLNGAKSCYVKWTLIAPAYYDAGWCPGFVDKTGKVQLKEQLERGLMTRKEWRKKLQNSAAIGAQLMAAKIPKALTVSGWKLAIEGNGAGGAAKATKLLVPAGAVYYFECDNKLEAQKLIKSLHGQTKSDYLGEQGFGLGLCSSWTLQTI